MSSRENEKSTYRFSDICKVINGRAYKNNELLENGKYRVLRVGNFFSSDRWYYSDLELSEDKYCNHGDLLYAWSASFGPKLWDGEKVIYHYHIWKLEPTEIVCRKFLYYWLIQSREKMMSGLHGSVMGHLTKSGFEKQEISIPSLPEQKAIAATLSCLDDKIELNNRMNKNLEEMAQAIFISWFVDFEPFQEGEFEESELGMIPKGWRVGTLSDLGEIVGGSTPSKSKNEYFTDKGIPWITPKDLSINKNKFIFRGEQDITELGLKNSSAKLMPQGTVLFSSRAPIGYIAIAMNSVTTNQGFKSIIPKNTVGNSYIYFYLKNNLDLIESRASGSTFKEVSGAIMKSIPALVPDQNVLLQFQQNCELIFQKQAILESQNQQLKEIRDTLLPKLMSGEVRVPYEEVI